MLDGQSVIITGGTGSWGNACVGRIFRDYHPRRIVVFSRDELKQAEMRRRWPDTPGSPVRYMIGDVRSKERLARAFDGIDIVFHAAAMKRIESCEYDPKEAFLTNTVGAVNVIDAAIDCGVKRVVALGTDKLVNANTTYGASKFLAERLFVQANSYSGQHETRFSCVRYGNVLGSRGSVIPLWRQQAKTGEITITHTEMTRFWLTIDDAVDFVLTSLEMMEGGEVFIPKVPSSLITDLAKAVAPDAVQNTIGLRVTEKMHEHLVSEEEARCTVDLGDRYAILPVEPTWPTAKWDNASHMQAGWSYSSLNNPQKLGVAELREMIARLGY